MASSWVLSDEGRALDTQLEAMISAYNFDGSDSMTDYFHVNFYGHVNIAGAMTRDEEVAAILDEHYEAINAQERAEVIAGNLDVLQHSFADGNTRNHDNELLETITARKLEDRA